MYLCMYIYSALLLWVEVTSSPIDVGLAIGLGLASEMLKKCSEAFNLNVLVQFGLLCS